MLKLQTIFKKPNFKATKWKNINIMYNTPIKLQNYLDLDLF